MDKSLNVMTYTLHPVKVMIVMTVATVRDLLSPDYVFSFVNYKFKNSNSKLFISTLIYNISIIIT